MEQKARHRGTSWKHKKRGHTYEWMRVAKVQTSKPIDENDEVVVYRDEKDVWWVRPVGEFLDGRFKKVAVEQRESEEPERERLNRCA